MAKKLKRRGFTDKLYFANLAFAWLFTILCYVLNLFSGKLGLMDLSIISSGLPYVWGELGLHTGFIIWKAKAENQRKFNRGNKVKDIQETDYPI